MCGRGAISCFLSFVFSENDDDVQPIESMPGVSRYGLNALIGHLKELVPKGLDSVLLFGVVEGLEKVSFKVFGKARFGYFTNPLPVLI